MYPADGHLAPCNATSVTQQWSLNASTARLYPAMPAAACMDVWNFVGPDVIVYSPCKAPGATDENERWSWDAEHSSMVSLDSQVTNGWACLAATNGASTGQWASAVSTSSQLCLQQNGGDDGTWSVAPCDTREPRQRFPAAPAGKPSTYTLGSMSYSNTFGASGPWPHSRYVNGYGGAQWVIDLNAASSIGAPIRAADNASIIDDDLVGGVTSGGDFCLDVRTWGMLEVWTAPLAGGRYAAVLFNRSPSVDDIMLSWSADLASWGDVPPTARFAVRDVWAASEEGDFEGAYTATGVPAHGVTMLILTPVA